MQLGLDIFTVSSLSLREGDFFSTAMQTNGTTIADGRDEYALQIVMLPGKRLAGTGRAHTYTAKNLICGMGHLEASPSGFTLLPVRWETLELRLETNRLLDYRELPRLLELELHWMESESEQIHRLSLHHPDLKIAWLQRGTYYFDLTAICKTLLANVT